MIWLYSLNAQRKTTGFRLSILFCCLLALPLSFLQAQQEVISLFEAGNRAYRASEYEVAIQQYELALEKGGKSHALFYNLASAHYRKGHVGKAILYYEKALKWSPYDARTQHSLRIAQKKIQFPIPQLPGSPFSSAWQYIRFIVGGWGLLWLGVLMYIAVIVFVGHWIWFKGEMVWRRRALMVLVPLMVLFLGMAYWASFQSETEKKVVVIEKQVELRQRPVKDAPTARTVSEGITLEVLSVREHWYEVRLPNGETGWLLQRVVANI